MNNNEETIIGLHAMADWLEQHPTMPKLDVGAIQFPNTKEELLVFVSELGSFEKKWNEDELRITKHFSPEVSIRIYIKRERICKKVVTWKCPDEGLLELANEMSKEQLEASNDY